MKRHQTQRFPNFPRYGKLATRWMLLLCLFAFTFFDLASSQLAAQNLPESDLRAAVIIGILRYTEWQDTHPSISSGAELTICAWGDAPSAISLENASMPIKIRNQVLKLQRLSSVEDVSSCPVLIWGNHDASSLLSGFKSKSLTICDDCDNLLSEVVIRLVRADNRVQFDVNLVQARSAGITFSSNLLELARNVEGI